MIRKMFGAISFGFLAGCFINWLVGGKFSFLEGWFPSAILVGLIVTSAYPYILDKLGE